MTKKWVRLSRIALNLGFSPCFWFIACFGSRTTFLDMLLAVAGVSLAFMGEAYEFVFFSFSEF